MRSAASVPPFLRTSYTTYNILEYISPLGVDGGSATAELLLPKRIFSVSLKEGFFSMSNSAVAKPTMPAASHISGGGKEGSS